MYIYLVQFYISLNTNNEKGYFNNFIPYMFSGEVNLNSCRLDTPIIILWRTCILQDDFFRFFLLWVLLLPGCFCCYAVVMSQIFIFTYIHLVQLVACLPT